MSKVKTDLFTISLKIFQGWLKTINSYTGHHGQFLFFTSNFDISMDQIWTLCIFLKTEWWDFQTRLWDSQIGQTDW